MLQRKYVSNAIDQERTSRWTFSSDEMPSRKMLLEMSEQMVVWRRYMEAVGQMWQFPSDYVLSYFSDKPRIKLVF
jgi:hypothetical protein